MKVFVTKEEVDQACNLWVDATKLLMVFMAGTATKDQIDRTYEQVEIACEQYIRLSEAYERQQKVENL